MPSQPSCPGYQKRRIVLGRRSGQSARWTTGGRLGEHPWVRWITPEHESLEKAHRRLSQLMRDHRRQLIVISRSPVQVGSRLQHFRIKPSTCRGTLSALPLWVIPGSHGRETRGVTGCCLRVALAMRCDDGVIGNTPPLRPHPSSAKREPQGVSDARARARVCAATITQALRAGDLNNNLLALLECS